MRKKKNNENINTILLILISLVVTGVAILYGFRESNGRTIAPNTIAEKRYSAPREVINEDATNRLREEAYKSVPSIYKRDTTIEEKVYESFNDLFAQLTDFRRTQVSVQNQQETQPEEAAEPTPTVNYSSIQDGLPAYLSDKQLEYLLSLSSKELEEFKETLQELLVKVFENGIKDNSEEQSLIFINEKLGRLYVEPERITLGYTILSDLIQPNLLVDETGTENMRQQKMAQVPSIKFLKNQTIVDAGQLITDDIYHVLESLGYVQKDLKEIVLSMIGTFLLLGVCYTIFIFYNRYFPSKHFHTKKEHQMFFYMYIFYIILVESFHSFPYFFLPVLIFTLLVAILIDVKMSIVANICFSTIALILVRMDLEQYIYFVLGGTVIAIASIYATERNKIIVVGLIASSINTILMLAIQLFFHNKVENGLLSDASLVFVNSIVSVIIAVGSLPFWEAAFGVVTNIKLLDLTNPNNELLRRLTIEAPGTYQHSLIVANLAEAAAIEVGANAIVVRVGAYYHDIGKLKDPKFFSENQLGENPHDKLPPIESAEIIKDHVIYGLELANTYHLPQIVKDMITAHHGNTLIKYFYVKEKKSHPEETVCEVDYRYPFGIPECKEVAIVMLADTVEAAVRSLVPKATSMAEVDAFVRMLVKDKLEDHQLQDSMLTLSDLEKIIQSFMRVLKGMYHERITYPSTEEK